MIHNGTVTVDGEPFARSTLEAIEEPWMNYGCPWSLRIRPALAPETLPDWSTTYQQIHAAILAHLVSRN